MRLCFIIFPFLLPLYIHSQIDSSLYNGFDDEGRKHGYWLCQVDSQLCKTESHDFAYYLCEFYDHGDAILNLSCNKWERKIIEVFTPDSSYNEDLKLLSGTVHSYDQQGKLFQITHYELGIQKYIRHYTYSDSTYYYEAYFTEKWNNQSGSAKVICYEDSLVVGTGWYGHGKNGWKTYYIRDSINPERYPYFKNVSPPLLGLLIGYNIYENHQIEFGLIKSVGIDGGPPTGILIGSSITYGYNLDKQLHNVAVEWGFYSVVSAGLGLNYNFNTNSQLLGFRPFIGTSIYHIQLLYGYNLFRNSKNSELDLSHHSLEIQVAIPIWSQTKYIDN